MAIPFDVADGMCFVRELVEEMGAIGLEKYGAVEASIKADGSLVTEADKLIEQLVRERLYTRYPDHHVYGEEAPPAGPADSPFKWFIDPIDGTNNFACGLPLWGVSVGLFREGVPCVGAFNMPCLRQTFWAGSDQGAYCNDRRLQVSRGTKLGRNDLLMVPATTLPVWDYTAPVRHRITGSAAYSMCLVAAGVAVGMIHHTWHVWDAGATLCILREAGALTTDTTGKSIYDITQWDYAGNAPIMVTASPEYHQLLMHSLKREN